MSDSKLLRRVVVTGMGLVSPLGVGVKNSWIKLIEGASGIRHLPAALSGDTSVKVGGLVPSINDDPLNGFDINRFIPAKDQKKSDRFIHLALAAAEEAVTAAKLDTLSEQERQHVATIIATGIGGFHSMTKAVNTVTRSGSKRLSPFTIPSFIANMAAAHVSIKYGFKGVLGTPVSACAASIQSIGDGFKTIINHEADIAVVGGCESCINPISLGGFNAAMTLSTQFNDTPEKASRPFDLARDGFVMSEGAGILILEDLEHAKNRAVDILAEVVGYGTTSDAYHITSGPQDGEGAARSMTIALKQANLSSDKIDYINAHSTSTPLGDLAEIAAVKKVFGECPSAFISSTKSSIGHLLGASGAAGSIFSIMSLLNDKVPASLNITHLDPAASTFNIIKNESQNLSVSNVLVNGFGFGGVNGSLVFRKYKK